MWLPWHTCAGRQKRIFSDEEEAALVSFVRDNFIACDLNFIDSNFREIAMNVFSTKKEDADPDLPMFQCSAGFVSMLKARDRLTFCKIPLTRQSVVTDEQRHRRVVDVISTDVDDSPRPAEICWNSSRDNVIAVIERVTKVMIPVGFPAAIQMEEFCDIQRDRSIPELVAGNANGNDTQRGLHLSVHNM
jgi:hypothetical protein